MRRRIWLEAVDGEDEGAVVVVLEAATEVAMDSRAMATAEGMEAKGVMAEVREAMEAAMVMAEVMEAMVVATAANRVAMEAATVGMLRVALAAVYRLFFCRLVYRLPENNPDQGQDKVPSKVII